MAVDVVKDELDQTQFDPFRIEHKQAGYAYRLLNKHGRNLPRRAHKGWEICTDGPERLVLTESTPLKKGADLDGTQQFSDVILARMPEERLARHRVANAALIKRQSGAPIARFKHETGGVGFEEKSGGTGYAGSMSESEFAASQKGK